MDPSQHYSVKPLSLTTLSARFPSFSAHGQHLARLCLPCIFLFNARPESSAMQLPVKPNQLIPLQPSPFCSTTLSITWYFTMPCEDRLTSTTSSFSDESLIIGPNSGSLPTTIVTTWIAHVKLEAKALVISSEKEGDPKGAEATKLCVALFSV
ncbi:hypothetical protein GOP47_0001330 [Adiantum capillus-veneris]|uniref:Uncharacterized protein n=1 Tax=Adiantum capillus-veneris TaxID=13818 RepID=A0A9D4V8N6_ADICA|nr:hypothetical protein GOP47_0001330 [Adiantum capillus-veneris]